MGLTEARLDSIRSRWIFRWPSASTTTQFAFNDDLITSQLVINTVCEASGGIQFGAFRRSVNILFRTQQGAMHQIRVDVPYDTSGQTNIIRQCGVVLRFEAQSNM